MAAKKRILFVDDEPKILEGLRRLLRSMRQAWEMGFVESGMAALERLAQEPFDIVVTDMRMPGMDGGQLLSQVRTCYPGTIRIVLSGQADREAILGAVGPIHQYLAKPCEGETLKAVLSRACLLGDLLADEALKQHISQMETLPSLPSLYEAVMAELKAPTASEKRLGQMISRDMGMSAKVLQLVSSAFFGIQSHTPHPAQAVTLLGLDTLKTLGLSEQLFSQLQTATFSSPAKFWAHSFKVACMAHQIATTEGFDQKLVDYSFVAGLLHDAGKLALATYAPERYAQTLALAAQEGIEALAAERQIFDQASHAEAGAYLLGLWGLPEPVVDTLLFHHQPNLYKGETPNVLAAVHVANVLDYKLAADPPPIKLPELDLDYLVRVGVVEHLPMWQEICEKTMKEC